MKMRATEEGAGPLNSPPENAPTAKAPAPETANLPPSSTRRTPAP
eukprot:CAMPEP_0113704112 /NCGR_PEP_ID=MMETSP0038_2-20120614/26313_1 /TAXON_ID=2898 /ORGANISM="Cryptomonas paramecium" /LENGTH=44 /DNA_ID=CAMNT_0000628807 /DNA_START=180 /DNA_END=310 /DNA_ORIENTATION=- /assembly_acc=CAM_ASM_000170